MNKIIIPTSLGITAIMVLVAFVSFGMIDTDDVLTTETELEYYDTSNLLLPSDDPLFSDYAHELGGIDFDWHLDESKYDHLVTVIEKYDDILVYEIYDEIKTSESEIYDVIQMMREEGASEDSITEAIEYYENKEPRIEDYTKIYLSQDPLVGTEYQGEYTYRLEGITITMWPKGDYTTEEKLTKQHEGVLIHEVSQRIIGHLTPMKQVILDDGRIHTFPTKFSYIDDEHVISIVGAITTEQVSALAMAISEHKEP